LSLLIDLLLERLAIIEKTLKNFAPDSYLNWANLDKWIWNLVSIFYLYFWQNKRNEFTTIL
jgi:hypothetical protein